MKRTAIILLLIVCLTLSGCGPWLSREYLWEQEHLIPSAPDSGQNVVVADYGQLVKVLTDFIERGTELFSVSVAQYDRTVLERDVDQAVASVRATNPIAAYAVSDVTCRIGTVAGETVLVVQVDYLHDHTEISNILTVSDNEAAKVAIGNAMNECSSGIVLRVESFVEEDFMVAAELYAMQYPQYVMETPQISVTVYPESGTNRVLVIRFNYANSRDVLRDMQSQVLTVFDASVNMVSLATSQKEKYQQMYVLMMERFQKYTIETSVTPAYSLLLHGVGDARAFAILYAAMCHEAQLECYVVTGTKGGKQWYWNIVNIDGVYYHVDLLRSKGDGTLRLMTDQIINEGYVWDFSAYPKCTGK